MIAAMTQGKVVSAQLTEGGNDAVVFEAFLYSTLHRLRTDRETSSKHIVLLMDNASIHKRDIVFETVRKYKVNVLLNA